MKISWFFVKTYKPCYVNHEAMSLPFADPNSRIVHSVASRRDISQNKNACDFITHFEREIVAVVQNVVLLGTSRLR